MENVFDDNEVGLMLEALQKLKRDFYDREDPWGKEPVRNVLVFLERRVLFSVGEKAFLEKQGRVGNK